MSGEVVILSAALGGAGLALGVAAAGLVAVNLAARWIEGRREEAHRHAVKVRESINEWQDFHRNHQSRIREQQARSEALRSQLERLELSSAGSERADPAGARARGFVSPWQAISPQLEAMAERLPPEVLSRTDSPVVRLLNQAADLDARARAGNPPGSEVLASYRAAVRMTVESTLREWDAEEAARTRMLSDVRELLEDVILYRQLAQDTLVQSELSALQNQLQRVIGRGEVANDTVAILRTKLRQLAKAVDSELEQAATGHALRSRVDAHLQDLGYRSVATPSDGPAAWEIPGGERVRAVLQGDNRLAFQVTHERAEASGAPLSREETAFYHRQEERWCGDLQLLLSRLRADGFELKVAMERDVPHDSIPVVVLEDVNDWLDDETEALRPRRQFLNDPD